MKTVVILGFPGVSATSVTVAADLYCSAGVYWNYLKSEPLQARFAVRLAAPNGTTFTAANGLKMQAHCSLADLTPPDIIVVPALGVNAQSKALKNRNIIDWLTQAGHWDCDIAASGTGVFLAAAAGVFDARAVSVHWGYAPAFKRKFAKPKLIPDVLTTSDGNRFTAVGGVAWMHLTLQIIERHCGYEVAEQVAQAYVLDYREDAASTGAGHAWSQPKRYHRDQAIHAVQDWLAGNYASIRSINSLARRFDMSSRTFVRRFKNATGSTPVAYIQRLRIAAAKRALAQTHLNLDAVTQRVGYEDASSFSKLFRTKTGLTPSQYRKRFQIT